MGSYPGVSAPLGVSHANPVGVSVSFPGSNTKIRNLVPRSVSRKFEFRSVTMEVSAINYSRIDRGVSGQNTRSGTPDLVSCW